MALIEDLRKPNNGFSLEKITRQMIRTCWEVRMAIDGQDENGLQNLFLKTVQDEHLSNIQLCL